MCRVTLGGVHRPDPVLPPLVSRAAARDVGLSDRQITRRLATGEWRAVRRGLLLPARPALAGPPQVLDLEMLAAVRSTGRDVAVAVAQAARVWDLPRPLDGWGKPMLLALSGPTRNQDDLCIRVAPWADGDLVVLPDGLVVTSPGRTVADCLRHLRPPDAVAVADRALRTGLVTRAEIDATLVRMKGWPGVVQARRLAALADGRRESTLESWSAVAFDDTGVPQPVVQVDIEDRDGPVGRVDFRWKGGLIGESDGRAKYLLRAAELAGADADGLAQVLAEERERERRLRATGANLVRWGPADVLVPARTDRLAALIDREMRDQRHRRVTGTARPAPLMLEPSTGLRRFQSSERYRPRA